MKLRVLLTLVVAVVGVSGASAAVVIGNFEQSSPGWGRWSGGVQPFDANYIYTTHGATLDTFAMQYTNPSGGSAVQSFAYSAGAAGTIADFQANNKLLFDVTFPATSVDGWAEIREIAFNSQDGGFEGRLQGAAGQVGWGAGGGGAQTITLEFDYSNHKAAWGSNTPGWIEVIIQTNSDAAHNVFQLDNVRLTGAVPEPASFALLGMAVSGMLACGRFRRAV